MINGPNLNLLGQREPEVYGMLSAESIIDGLRLSFPSITFHYYQSNHEGDLIDKVQEFGMKGVPIVLNPGGYTHTSVALRDAIAAVKAPVVEVHLSNIHRREDFRRISLTAPVCEAVVSGLGKEGYRAAVAFLLQN